jgi:hypothetical protein
LGEARKEGEKMQRLPAIRSVSSGWMGREGEGRGRGEAEEGLAAEHGRLRGESAGAVSTGLARIN